ncbi:hypothetical protein H6P81_017387 [Aristolochia fimbriata]|uniref:Uncharacterized protein n=1 Tax=Aristolochia fimbriata TaxID=158543 RepID=A0AAV7DYF6_ARIFI|nr:hypothetical protein H6P81_017387 [Aristolochia fimbriata]
MDPITFINLNTSLIFLHIEWLCFFVLHATGFSRSVVPSKVVALNSIQFKHKKEGLKAKVLVSVKTNLWCFVSEVFLIHAERALLLATMRWAAQGAPPNSSSEMPLCFFSKKQELQEVPHTLPFVFLTAVYMQKTDCDGITALVMPISADFLNFLFKRAALTTKATKTLSIISSTNRLLKKFKFDMLEGISPESLFLDKSNDSSCLNSPIILGTPPFKLLLPDKFKLTSPRSCVNSSSSPQNTSTL